MRITDIGGEKMEKVSFHHIPTYKMCAFRRFEEGEKHITRCWHEHVLIFMIDGTLRFTEDGEEKVVCKNHYYIQKAFRMQSADCPSEGPYYFWVHFEGGIEETEDGIALEGEYDPLVMLPLFKEMERICHDTFSTKFEKRFVFYRLLAALDSSQKEVKSSSQLLAERVHDLILEEYASSFSMDEVSKRLGYSKNYLIDVFDRHYGVTPYKFANHLRIEKSRQLLISTDMSCQNISDACGFSEYSAFYKLFRARFGTSPGEYKKNMQTKR